MLIGTRVLYPEEVDYWDADLLQISVYRGMNGSLEYMRKCARACKDAGIRYVIHPVKYSLLQNDMFGELMEMAELADLALIMHDERSPEGGRLEGKSMDVFTESLSRLKAVAQVSIENSADTGDAGWFWENFADSVTLDIGHVESSGLNSLEFVTALDHSVINKIRFVHIHRNNGLRGGITDHWPLTPHCREVLALRELVRIKPDVSVILELNEIESIVESLNILRNIRQGTAAY
ncbi:MAG: hypothetical protein C4581_12770 [Nitrospiraceae bacterium]|nr:MAG: hypothetical protein C4581_12770 [Nitrospiraceae bacterium]